MDQIRRPSTQAETGSQESRPDASKEVYDVPTLADLYPSLSARELDEAKDNLCQYVTLVMRVLQRLELDPDANARFQALTVSRKEHRIKNKGLQSKPRIDK